MLMQNFGVRNKEHYGIFCSGQLHRPDSPMAQFKTATIPCQLQPQKRPMLTDAQTAFEWQKEDVDTFRKVNSKWQKTISDLILAHHRRPTGSYSSQDDSRKFSFTLTLALLNLTVNFHRVHSIVSTSCPWVSEDDPSLIENKAKWEAFVTKRFWSSNVAIGHYCFPTWEGILWNGALWFIDLKR